MRWLVTGGAGYIGAHVTAALQDAGHTVTVYDNLSTGSTRRLRSGTTCHVGDIRDARALRGALDNVDGVCHLAALKSAPESLRNPSAYWDVNVEGTATLLDCMRDADVRRMMFASSAAVYAAQDRPVIETDPLGPSTPYGVTKHAGEVLVREASAWGLRAVSLRFYNVFGAAHAHLADEQGEGLPALVRAAVRDRGTLTLYGTDYPTSDGTAVRDYVHVVDLAAAHVRVIERMDTLPHEVYNVGTGRGMTVREFVAAQDPDGRVQLVGGPRRAGDLGYAVASVDRLVSDLCWRPSCNVARQPSTATRATLFVAS
jgi:UDP-glucose 4-epimerase